MNEPENSFSRIDRKKGPNQANTIMNILIAIVVVLIIITASMIFFGGNDEDKAEEKKSPDTEESIEGETKDNEEDVVEDTEGTEEENAEEEASSDAEEPIDESDAHESGVLINKSPEDDYVKETIIDTDWKPIGTKQQGEHVSIYDKTSDDWHEKIDAISYATELSKDDMSVWWIGNGGNSQKSVGIVSSKDKSEKYRVYLDWVDNEGWQPVKMDILKSLDFEY